MASCNLQHAVPNASRLYGSRVLDNPGGLHVLYLLTSWYCPRTMRQRAGDGFETISSEPAYARPAPFQYGGEGGPAGVGAAAGDAGEAKHHEWDTEAISWRVSQLAKPANRTKLIVVVAVALVVLVGTLWWALRAPEQESLAAPATLPNIGEVAPAIGNDELIEGCVAKCSAQLSCDAPCRSFVARSPRCGVLASTPGPRRVSCVLRPVQANGVECVPGWLLESLQGHVPTCVRDGSPR